MLLINAVNAAGRPVELFVKDGKIAAVGQDLSALAGEGETVLDAGGLTVLPAFVDLHCHWRTPGFEYKEDIATGSMAAAAGGYTFVNLMPNTKPICSSAAQAAMVEQKAAEVGLCDVNQTVSITENFDGKTIDHLKTLPASVKFITEDGHGVQDNATMARAFAICTQRDITVMSHAEDMEISPWDYRLAEDLGVKVNYVSTEAANRIEYLQTGKVDIILANFTVTPERAEEVDFALPYMNVALGVISPDSNVITSLDNWNADDQMIVISGTTAETYLTKEYPDIPLQKYDSYATAKNALENGNGAAWANDNTEVIAFAKQNSGYTVGIPSLGSQDTIAPAVSKGNTTLLDWINDEIKSLGEESFFHKDYEETLVDTYGLDYEDELVVEGGESNA